MMHDTTKTFRETGADIAFHACALIAFHIAAKPKIAPNSCRESRGQARSDIQAEKEQGRPARVSHGKSGGGARQPGSVPQVTHSPRCVDVLLFACAKSSVSCFSHRTICNAHDPRYDDSSRQPPRHNLPTALYPEKLNLVVFVMQRIS